MTQPGIRRISIVGAGFSGLVSAYALRKAGWEVQVFEASERAGGLLATRHREWGQIETAANAFVNSPRLQELGREIGIEWIYPLPSSRNRYVYWRDRPARWPLNPFESLGAFSRFALKLSRRPRDEESVESWGRRVLGATFTERVLAPALQGVYAANASELSAKLVLASFFDREHKKARAERRSVKPRGSVAPAMGMGDFVLKLQTQLESLGVNFSFSKKIEAHDMRDRDGARWLLATSASTAARLLSEREPEISQSLSSVRMRGLLSATLHFAPDEGTLPGFGILFPRSSGFETLGVLFNSFIFEGRAKGTHSESWILSGEKALRSSDSQLLADILRERSKLYKRTSRPPMHHSISRCLEAIPVYDSRLERFLKSDARERLSRGGVELIGNYLGELSLSRILDRAFELPLRLGQRDTSP
jgi:oxygen-dependent protoporphyrinogen oxidase